MATLATVAAALILLLAATAAHSATSPSPSPSPTPAPAPAPAWVNVTQILEAAGQFRTFVSLVISTGVDDKLQALANQTETGVTVFAPTDAAFDAEPAASRVSKLTSVQKAALLEYHAIDAWTPFAVLQRYDENPTVMYGSGYVVNVTDDNGTVELSTPWTKANITSTLYNARPVSVFAIDRVLMPDELFGLPPPPPPPSPPVAKAPSSSASPLSSPGSGLSGSPLASTSFAPRAIVPKTFILGFLALLVLCVFLA